MYALLWIDRFISKGIQLLIVFMFSLLVFILGLTYITGFGVMPGIFEMVFEYEESLWDLSNAEFGYLLLFAAIMLRHVKYCTRCKLGVWSAVSKPIFYLGYLAIAELIIVGILDLTAIYSGDSSWRVSAADIFSPLDGVEQFFGFIFIFLAVYLSTPTPQLEHISNTESSESVRDSENVIYADYQE